MTRPTRAARQSIASQRTGREPEEKPKEESCKAEEPGCCVVPGVGEFEEKKAAPLPPDFRGGVASTNPFLLDHCRKADKERADCEKYFMRKEIFGNFHGLTVKFFQCKADGD